MIELSRMDIAPMAQDDAEAIARWRYDPPYDFYDADANHRDPLELVDPTQRGDRYFSAHDAHGVLVGYFGFACKDGVVGVGVGMRPDLTGLGLGQRFLEAGLAYARERFAPHRFKLVVATFNQRAIRVYERVGFVTTRSFEHETNGHVFSYVEMKRAA